LGGKRRQLVRKITVKNVKSRLKKEEVEQLREAFARFSHHNVSLDLFVIELFYAYLYRSSTNTSSGSR